MIKQHLRTARNNLTKLAKSENAFREVAKYAYAMNQSSARFVMDPISSPRFARVSIAR